MGGEAGKREYAGIGQWLGKVGPEGGGNGSRAGLRRTYQEEGPNQPVWDTEKGGAAGGNRGMDNGLGGETGGGTEEREQGWEK